MPTRLHRTRPVLTHDSAELVEAGHKDSTSVTVALDTFTRADAGSLGSTEVGGFAWSALAGTWGITGNKAYLPVGAADSLALITTTVADCTVSITVNTVASVQGVAFRGVDGSNYWRVVFSAGNFYLNKFVAGVGSDVGGSPIVLSPANGDVISVVLSGPSIIVKVNGVTKYSTSDAQFQTAVRHGLAQPGFGDATCLYDNFTVTVP